MGSGCSKRKDKWHQPHRPQHHKPYPHCLVSIPLPPPPQVSHPLPLPPSPPPSHHPLPPRPRHPLPLPPRPRHPLPLPPRPRHPLPLPPHPCHPLPLPPHLRHPLPPLDHPRHPLPPPPCRQSLPTSPPCYPLRPPRHGLPCPSPLYHTIPLPQPPFSPCVPSLSSTSVLQPLPYVDHQAFTVKNKVNVHKDTIQLQREMSNPDCYLVSFTFDSLVDGSITIFYFAKEGENCSFMPVYPDIHIPVRVPFEKGLGQKFCQPSGSGIDLGFFALDDLSKPSQEDVFPLIVSAEAFPETKQTGDGPSKPQPSGAQITQAVLEKRGDAQFQVKVIKQILWVDGERYELKEIFGLADSAKAEGSSNDSGEECVICMTEPKNTAVLPCRHMCMCSECAKALRLQSNKCPICRQPVEEIMEINVSSSTASQVTD